MKKEEIIEMIMTGIKDKEIGILVADLVDAVFDKAYLQGMKDVTRYNHTRECGYIKKYENKSSNN